VSIFGLKKQLGYDERHSQQQKIGLNHVALTIFDLDNTLLAGDSDYLWGQFLAQKGIVDGDFYERENRRFYDDYKAGQLDIYEFLAFSLAPLAKTEPAMLQSLQQEFMQTVIAPIILPAGRELVKKHRDMGNTLLIITATNRFVTAPIAQELGVDNLLATDPEQLNGRYTGRVTGTPTFKEGKVKRLHEWLAATHHSLDESWFFSDSLNDIPLLEIVTYPVAVDPDDTLAQHAEMRGWEIMSLRE